jgi:hypothetical protein
MTSTDKLKTLNTPEKIREEGEEIYARKHKEPLEKSKRGQFVAIDVLTGEAYVAEAAEKALLDARTAAPNGIFHLIRIGAPGAVKASFSSHHAGEAWFSRQAR